MVSIRALLLEIQNSQVFEKLEAFKPADVWQNWESNERTLLAQLLIMQGSQQIAAGDPVGLENFQIATEASSQAIDILYQQATCLASCHENIRCLHLASEKLQSILQQDPLSFPAWYAKARVCTRIANFEEDSAYLLEAHRDFEKAESLLPSHFPNDEKNKFYCRWATSVTLLGKLSGEPQDFIQAVKKYQQIYLSGYQEPSFLNQYGSVLVKLGRLLENQEYFTHALALFNKAIRLNEQEFDSWYNQAMALYYLTELTFHEKVAEQSDRSFAKAAQLNPTHSSLWYKWGQLQALWGKIKRNPRKLQGSLDKFAKASDLDPSNPDILNCWAEAQLSLGSQTENIIHMQAARARIVMNLEIQKDNSDSWYLYGWCLNELGHYFEDQKYYQYAIEKFQNGLTFTQNYRPFWYGLALSHFALGDLLGKQNLIEKGIYYLSCIQQEEKKEEPYFWNDWGIALLKLAEMTQQTSYAEMAIEKFEKAFQEIQETESEDLNIEWMYHYGCALDILGDIQEEPSYIEKAIHTLTQVVQLDPHWKQARHHLALALFHLGEITLDVDLYEKATEYFYYLAEQDPEDEQIHIDLGITLTNLAQLIEDSHQLTRSQTLYKQAEHHFLQAAALGNTQSYYQLAGLYSIIQHYAHSLHYLERAKFYGTLPDLEDLLHDEWLEKLRETDDFSHFISELPNQKLREDK
jgi:tetratricopeptide (TPR) repeat protein